MKPSLMSRIISAVRAPARDDSLSFRRSLQAGYRHGKAIGESRSSGRASMYYPAADQGRLRGDWGVALQTATSLIRSEYKKIAARAEQACRTDAIARRTVQVLKTFSIGQGLRPYPTVMERDGVTPATRINAQLAEHWRRFDDQCMRCGNERMTQMEAQGVEFQNIVTLGSSLCNIVRSRKGSWLPFAFQLVKPTILDFGRDNYFGATHEKIPSSPILHGVRRNEYLEPVGFFIEGEDFERSSKQMSLHYYAGETGAYLGMPWLTPVLANVWDNQQLRQDKMVQSRAMTQMGFWTGEKSKSEMEAMLTTDDGGTEEYIPLDHGMQISTKEKPEPVQLSDDISEQYASLVKLNILEVGVGMGFSYQLLTSDMEGMNFAASRSNKVSDSRFFRGISREFAHNVCAHRWEKFVEWEIISGKLDGVSYSEYASDPWRFQQALWLPEGDEWVDPLKDAQGMEKLYQLGVATYQQLCAAKGRDHIDIMKQRALEKKQFKEYDLEELLPERIFAKPGAVAQQADTVDTEDEPAKKEE